MGRADQTTKIRGMFVHPGRWPRSRKRFPEVVTRLVVTGEMANDAMTLQGRDRRPQAWTVRISEAIREVPSCAARVELVLPAACPTTAGDRDARSYK